MDPRRTLAGAMLASLAAASLLGCTTGSSAGPAASTMPSVSPAGGGSIPDEIVGAWTTTITEADLRAAGITEPAGLAENSGLFTMTLGADGSWSTAQVTDAPVRWPVFKGTYEVTGPSAFRQVTTFPPDYAGDVVDFTWSVRDGALVLSVPNPPDPILPILVETHPWQPRR
jgi:hypothetical protein